MKAFLTLLGQKLSSRKFWVLVATYAYTMWSTQLSAHQKTVIIQTVGPAWIFIEGAIDFYAARKPPTPPAP